ncbi:MAG: right-handed parallel beta-helix repeat-containing protein, partial [Deltaproteobacteria bacterium]|nr:right-handed parallel beta-helix repeat-containing protein [Deltaproteobacteria bacterium]
MEWVYAGWPTKHIALGPGTFEVNLDVTGGSGRAKINSLSIEGCSADETVLHAASDDHSIIEVSEAKAVRVTGVTLEGGRRALRVRDGAKVHMRHSRIEGSTLVAALVQDRKSQLFLRDTEIWDTVPEDSIGWGVAVLDGKLHMTDSSIHKSTGIGLFADAAKLELTDIEVHDTLPSGRFNALGRGIHVQNGSEITMTGGLLQNNADAGIFLLDVTKAIIDGVMIDITSAGIVIDFPST